MIKQIKNKLSCIPKKAFVAIGLAAILIIGITEWIPEKSVSEKTEDPKAYAAELEARLAEILSSMEGVGRCRVMVTLENGVEYVYASEQSKETNRTDGDGKTVQKDDTARKVVVVGSGNGREGLLVTAIQPTVRGVAVICEGGGNQEIRARVVDTVATVLQIAQSKVSISQ